MQNRDRNPQVMLELADAQLRAPGSQRLSPGRRLPRGKSSLPRQRQRWQRDFAATRSDFFSVWEALQSHQDPGQGRRDRIPGDEIPTLRGHMDGTIQALAKNAILTASIVL